ncbi:MAG: DUF4239 domain-containing protein [Candidatus Eremiobacteraeota bacterium]|nr:DUF4239 domain-containing protein [Candidatus Eremiobacteraeota bacterium]
MIHSKHGVAARGTPRAALADIILVAGLLAAAIAAAVLYKNPAYFAQLSNISPVLLLAIAVPAAVTSVCAGQAWVHHRFAYKEFVQHNEVGGFIIAVTGSLYAVVLGFLTVVAWQQYTDARQLVAAESAAAADAWHVALGLPPLRRHRVRDDVLEYSRLMVSQEWPAMSRGDSNLQSAIVIMNAIGSTEDFTPANLRESNAQTATLAQLGVMHDDRQRRLADNRSGVMSFEWLVLIIGAVCVICFCWLFGLANARVHLLMTSTVTIIITATLVLLFELQNPFRSGLGIDATDWSAVIDHIHFMQSAPQSDMRM